MLRGLQRLFVLGVLFIMTAGLGVIGGYIYFGRDVPNLVDLRDYHPSMVTRVYANDGRLMAEFGKEKRVFVPIDSIPRHVVDAFLAAEDKNFENHFGVDVPSIAVAALKNVLRVVRGQRMIGASTITQQVAKIFLVGDEYSLTRKIKEAILAVRIEYALDKEQILEIYLNQIFLGRRAHGVVLAALNYFDKPLDRLTIGESAYLAALPKAPNNYHPQRHRDAAITRRNWVIGRMLEDGRITAEQADAAWVEPFQVVDRQIMDEIRSHYFAEEIRRELLLRYGEDMLYGGGMTVRSTLDPDLQKLAVRALRKGLVDYDRRHGWRGPLGTLATEIGWPQAILAMRPLETPENWHVAVVRDSDGRDALIQLADGTTGVIPFKELQWARPALGNQQVGRSPRSAGDVVSPGDVILVEALPPVAKTETVQLAAVETSPDDGPLDEGRRETPSFILRQLPEVEGALVAMDPHTGRVLAMQGGFSTERSQFNRATQALRQPGSSFKPFIYLAALADGFPPNASAYDEPFVIDQGVGMPPWRPANYDRKSLGLRTLRYGIERSRNLMTVRLADRLGMEKVAEFAERFGVYNKLEPVLSMSLGAGETTLMKMVGGYAMIANGGKKITPTFMDSVQDRDGRTVYRHDLRFCPDCQRPLDPTAKPPAKVDTRLRLVDELSAFQMVSILQGVVQRGTGIRLASLELPLAGKTGTTNDYFDAWFIGFSSDLVVGVYVGFDQPRTLGRGEAGSRTALPVFKTFMTGAVKKYPAVDFRPPEGIKFVNIHRGSGVRISSGGILEAFKPDQVPNRGASGPVIAKRMNAEGYSEDDDWDDDEDWDQDHARKKPATNKKWRMIQAERQKVVTGQEVFSGDDSWRNR